MVQCTAIEIDRTAVANRQSTHSDQTCFVPITLCIIAAVALADLHVRFVKTSSHKKLVSSRGYNANSKFHTGDTHNTID